MGSAPGLGPPAPPLPFPGLPTEGASELASRCPSGLKVTLVTYAIFLPNLISSLPVRASHTTIVLWGPPLASARRGLASEGAKPPQVGRPGPRLPQEKRP